MADQQPQTTGDQPVPKEKKLTKKELRILERNKKAAETTVANPEDPERYCDNLVLQSKTITDRKWTEIEDLNPTLKGTEVWVRGRVSTVRATGKTAFILLRHGIKTVQCVALQGPDTPKEMLKYIGKISKESVVDIFGQVLPVETPIQSATQQDVELHVRKIFTLSKSDPVLPFQLEDASRPDAAFEEENSQYVAVNLDTRLNYRWVDLRTPTSFAIMKIQSAVCRYFREFLQERNFIEIHTPKLLGGASEGGATVFTLKYFDTQACLAQSPQIHKQIAAACCGLERVFEIGPVFRAENSLTHRHLCEFTGLDFEMTIKEHYYEVLEVFSDLFIHIFDKLNEDLKEEMAIVNEQYPFEPLQYLRPTLRLTFAEGCAMLQEAGVDKNPLEDLSTEEERILGKLVKQKYHTDFFILDKFPLGARPFYTMPDPENPQLSNSYDLFIRGEEIVSGAQRIHDLDLLLSRAKDMGIPQSSLKAYVDAFKHGTPPHGGGGIGLERVVMLFLGLKNIRKVSMFPRDPKRIAP